MLPEFKDPRVYFALGRGAVGSGRLRSEAFTAGAARDAARRGGRRVRQPRPVRGDRSGQNKVIVSAIFSWREKEFAAAYADKAPAVFAHRSPIERAILAFVEPKLLATEREFLAQNAFQVVFEPFDWSLNDLTGRGGQVNLDLEPPTRSPSSPARAAGSAWRAQRALVREGCRVTICAGRGRAGRGRGGARAATRAATIASWPLRPTCRPPEASDVVTRTVETFGGLDILVNNVGLARGAGIVDTTDAEWQEAFDQTLFPAIRASRLAVPHMRRGGGGSIVMIASIWGRESGGRMTYNAVKAAEISLAKSMAQQLARDNIRVNSVAPGSILFPGGSWDRRQQDDPAGIADFVARELPFGRFGRPEEVGAVVAFLVSPRASWISGASVPVDGCQSRSLI